MSSLGGSTVSSSYNRLLVLPAGGGDGTNLVSLTDGDAGTTFALKISTHDVSVPSAGKIYLDGGGSTYIHNADNGRIEMWANGQMMLWCDKAGSDNNVEVRAETFNLRNANGDSPKLMFHSIKETSGTAQVHAIEPGGTDYTDDILLLGRTDSSTSTNVVLNAKVGIGTHINHPTGPLSAFHLRNGGDCDIHIDSLSPILGVGITTSASGNWERSYSFHKKSDLSMLGGFYGYGANDTLTKLSMGTNSSTDAGIHWDMTNGRCGIGITTPTSILDTVGTGTQTWRLKSSDGSAVLKMVSGTDNDAEYIYFANGAANAVTGKIKYQHSATDANERMEFYVNGSTEPMALHGNGRVGIGFGNSTPTAMLFIQNADATGVPCLHMSQEDVDQPFFNLDTTASGSGTSNAIITDTTTDNAKYGAMMISVGGVKKWIRIYDGPS